MKKRYTPKTLIEYLLKEFTFSLLIFFIIFSTLIIFISFIEDLIFLREKNSLNFFFESAVLALLKTPTVIMTMSPFIFLFSGIFYFVRLMKNNEITPISLSGLSNIFITLVPSLFAFIFGIFLIIVISPFSSELLKQYETIKQKYTSNDNLIIMSSTGLWVKDRKDNNSFIIRADKIDDENFNTLSNVTIYKFDNENTLIERIESKNAFIEKDKWKVIDALIITNDKEEKVKKYDYYGNFNIEELKKFFINPNIFSVWNIYDQLLKIRDRGYFGQELIIAFHKYLSLPFLLFSMIVISTFFTLKINLKYNNFVYAFFGIIAGILIYFLLDLSIAIGKSGKIPLEMSIWVPILSIFAISILDLLKNNE